LEAPHFLTEFLAETGRIALFSVMVLRRGFAKPPDWRAVLEEMYNVGVRGLPVLIAVAAFIGTNVALQGYHAFKPLGGESLVGMFVSVAGIRELAPLIATAIIAAKTGTEMTTTLAMMRITEQIDALEVMGVNPYWYLVTPRLVSTTLMLPVLTILANGICFGTGFAVSVYQLHVDPGTFMDAALNYISMQDLYNGILKASVFGVIICILACYYGFHSARGPLGIGQAANKAIVMMVVICTLTNYFLTEVLYG